MEDIGKDKKDEAYRKLRKLVLDQASCAKKRKSSKNAKNVEKVAKKSKKDEKKAKNHGKISKRDIKRAKMKEKPVIYRPLTVWSQRLIAMLKETIVCHRWKAAAKILNALTYEPDRTSELIAMAGFQIFCNHSTSNCELLNQFSNSMARMDKVFHPASILKNVMVLLINGDFSTAKRIIEDESVLKKILIPQLNEKQKNVLSILKAYKALFKYIDWVTCKEGIGQKEDDDAIYSQERQTRLQIHERGSLANNAIEMFEALFQEPGNWDMFVSKYLELMEFCDRKGKAIVTLHNYCKLNPLNPHAYIFLYDFVSKHFKHHRLLLVSTLKKLKLVKPCDERIFDFPKLLRSTDNCLELESYFNLIDHPQWRNDARVWNIFANRILHFYQFPVRSEFKKLGDLWRGRSDWWPEFHFVLREVKIRSEEMADLFVSKAVVFTALTNTGNEYTLKVRRKLSRRFQNHLKKLDAILKLFHKLDTSDPYEEYDNENTNQTTPKLAFDLAIANTIHDQSAELHEFSGTIAFGAEYAQETPSSELEVLDSDTEMIHCDDVFTPDNQNGVQNGVYAEEFEPGERFAGCEVTLFDDPRQLVEVCRSLTGSRRGVMDVTFGSSEGENGDASWRAAVDGCLEALESPLVEESRDGEKIGRKRAKKRRRDGNEDDLLGKRKREGETETEVTGCGKRKKRNENEVWEVREREKRQEKENEDENEPTDKDVLVKRKKGKRKREGETEMEVVERGKRKKRDKNEIREKENENEDESTNKETEKRRRENEKETNGEKNNERSKTGNGNEKSQTGNGNMLKSIFSWQNGGEKTKSATSDDDFVINTQDDMFDS